ncbi:MAG TPA: hypothetical protein VMD30_02305 [Tepidisphaeraceae bacterium]|nr:hypothetical protein [Tepidisphaeraceae bacterium]
MRLILVTLLLPLAAIPGCAPPPAPPVSMQDSYLITGDGPAHGDYPLQPGLTVSRAVRLALQKTGQGGPLTVIYIQRGPEGRTRHIIDLGPDLNPKNPRQDYLLRGGDELVLPSAAIMAHPH